MPARVADHQVDVIIIDDGQADLSVGLFVSGSGRQNLSRPDPLHRRPLQLSIPAGPKPATAEPQTCAARVRKPFAPARMSKVF